MSKFFPLFLLLGLLALNISATSRERCERELFEQNVEIFPLLSTTSSIALLLPALEESWSAETSLILRLLNFHTDL